MVLTDVFSTLGLQSFAQKLAVTLVLQALPEENKRRLADGNQQYLLTRKS
ncbi:hypothetical protein ACI2OX_19095 [Bacillus sp. N9]